MRINKLFIIQKASIFTIALALFSLINCVKKSHEQNSPTHPIFHADNDIAMIIRSMIDSIEIGDPLDSLQYDFEGVLTDGQGAPLYIDNQGSPGMWEIDVLNDQNAVIRNIYLGDLLAIDLRDYLATELGLESAHIPTGDSPEEVDTYLLPFSKGIIKYEIRNAVAANGLEGSYVRIFISTSY